MDLNKSLENKINLILDDFKKKNFEKVILKSKIILNKYPDNDFLNNIVALSYYHLKDYKKAEFKFINLIKKNPNNFTAKNNFGMLLQSMNKLDEAKKIFEEILDINPNYIGALNNLSNLHRDDGNYEKAIKGYTKIIEIDKNNIIARYNLSISLLNSRKKDLALENAYIINSLDPSFTEADKIISNLTNYKIDNKNHLNLMLEKDLKQNLSNEKKIQLYFAIGKAYEDKEIFDKSFKYYKLANEIAYKNIEYDFKKEELKFEKIKNLFLKLYSKKINFESLKQKKLIFICGMPRSGSTLIEQIISTHRDVASLGETDFLNKTIFKFFDFNQIKNIFLDKTSYSKNIIYNDYISQVDRLKLNKINFTDKSLLNFQYIGLIKIFFPNSKILLLNRDFNNILLSIFKNDLPALKWSYNINEIKKFYKLFKMYSKFWKNYYPNQILEVSYDEIINNFEITIRNILNFCELKWDANCLEYYKINNYAIKTASTNQADKPIYNESLSKFLKFEEFFK